MFGSFFCPKLKWFDIFASNVAQGLLNSKLHEIFAAHLF